LADELEEFSTLPSSLRERIEAVEEAIEEPPHPFIYRILIDEGTKAVIEAYMRKKEALRTREESIKEMSACLGVRRVDLGLVEDVVDRFCSGELKVVGIDAGTNALNLEVAHIPLCSAVAALCVDFDVADIIPSVVKEIPLWEDEIYPDWRATVLGFGLQFDLVSKAIEKWRPDIIFFDGPFLYSQLMRGQRRTDYWRDLEETVEKGIRALEFCIRTRTPIVGFVKRPEGCSVAKRLVEQGKLPRLVRDTVALRWMKPGYYISPLRYVGDQGEVGPRDVYSRMAALYTELARELGVEEEVVMVLFTYMNTGHTFPYKIELPEAFSQDVEEIMAIIFALRATRGIPFPIYVADSLTKVSNTTRDLFLLSLRAYIAEKVKAGELDEEDIDMFMPRHGEVYGLREEEPGVPRAHRRMSMR